MWLSRAIFVPIHTKHPPAEVVYILQDSAASLLLVHPELRFGPCAGLVLLNPEWRMGCDD